MLDLILRRGTVIDGTGARRFPADVGVQGDRIAEIGDLGAVQAHRSLDVAGMIVAPGFIDVHNHSDGWLLKTSHLVPKTSQGFTTEILMADGISYAPVSAGTVRQWFFYLRALNALRMDEYRGWHSLEEFMQEIDGRNVQNAAMHIPYANVRTLACGFGNGSVDDFQMRLIQQEIRRGLEVGAVGLSTGLDYLSQCHATTDELVEACRPLSGGDAPYVTHVRYKRGLLPALREAIEIGRRAAVPVHISHLKAQPPTVTADEVFSLLDEASGEVDISFDVYPYQPGSTMLNYLLPYEVWRDGPLAALGRLEDPLLRQRVADGFNAYRLDLNHIRIAWLPGRENAPWLGQTLGAYVAAANKPAVDALCELLIEERLAVLCVMDEGDDALVHPFLAHERGMLGSDGIYFPDGCVHPRMFGSATRLLGPCVRDYKLLELEAAVYKLSGFPARRFGLRQRGILRSGYFADLVVFDAERVRDRATYDQPNKVSDGIELVVVNGEPILEKGQPREDFAGRLPGRYLRRQ